MYSQNVGQSAIGNVSAPTPAQEESPSRIRDGITHCEETLSAIHDAISGLEKRLDTVLQPVPPQVLANDNAKPMGLPASHVQGRVTLLNEGFGAAVQRLRDLARRVEV